MSDSTNSTAQVAETPKVDGKLPKPVKPQKVWGLNRDSWYGICATVVITGAAVAYCIVNL